MDDIAKTLITLGTVLLLGLVTDTIGRRTRLPRVTLLLVFGFIIGPAGFDFLVPNEERWFPIVADMALIMIGFLLGERFTLPFLRQHGKVVLWISVAEVIVTSLVVLIGLLLLGLPKDMAFLLAGIATATDPAAITDVVYETQADGEFTRAMLGIVAIDDAWGLIVFSCMLTIAQSFNRHGGAMEPLLSGALDLGGALLVGIALGIPMAYVTGRIRPGEPSLVEALGVVFLCGGIAIWLKVSFLLASMVLGCVVSNLARHHIRPFHAIEDIEWPFMILFFVLAGASLQFETLYQIGIVGSAYIVFRIIGRLLGGWTGGAITNSKPLMRRWIGIVLMPQAGVALGMALVAIEYRPDLGEIILPVVITSTVLFELIGPVLTRIGLSHVGEVRSDL